MKNGVFVTATDTGVGKTFIASGLALCMKEIGMDVGVMKPVATGKSEDVNILKSINSNDDINDINPIYLPLEASPLIAKRILKKEIDISKIKSSFERLVNRHEYMIVEGIGGIMVPITESYMVIDMIKELNLPTIIVCKGALGTINHTLLTINALRTNSVKIAGIIANNVNNDLDEYAIDAIKEISNTPLLGKIPTVNIDEYLLTAKNAIKRYVRYDLLIT